MKESCFKGRICSKAGFTLIELLVVVLIIGILAAVAVPQYKKAVARTRVTEALAMVKAIADAQEAYYLANGEYPADITTLDVSVPDDRIAQGVTYGDADYPFRYMYSISGGNSYANACSPNLPILQYSALHKEIPEGEVDYRGIYYCVAAWKKNCAETKSEFAEEICKSMNSSGEIRDKGNGSIYYRIY